MVVFAWAYAMGIYVHENFQPIKIKKHGRWAKNPAKRGLQTIANDLINALEKNELSVLNFLSCR
jgi:hypothetical protein